MIIELAGEMAERWVRGQGFRRESRDGVSAFVGGYGPPIVLLHGALSRGATTWARSAGRLARRFRVVAPDLPGFGRSEAAMAPEQVTVQGVAERLLEVLPGFAGERYVVVGESLGGWVAARMTLSDAAAIEHMVLVDAAGRWTDPETARQLVPLITPRTREDLLELYARVVGRDARLPGWVVRDVLRTYQRDIPGLESIIAAGEADAIRDEELAGMLNRVAVIWGGRDRLISPEYGQAFAAAIPGATWDLIPESAHIPPWETPGKFVALVMKRVGAVALTP